MKKRLLGIFAMLLTFMIFLGSCTLPWVDDDPGIEYFMSYDSHVSICLENFAVIGYESERSRFDIDEDVVLTFHFGFWLQGGIEKRREQMDIPWFEIYFVEIPQYYGDDNTIECFIERREEQFVSEKYGYTKQLSEDGTTVYRIYNHSEDIVIPKEMFHRDSGAMWIVLRGPNLKSENTEPRSFLSAPISYKKTDKMIELR